jgi:hypothetical protein
MSGDDLDLRNFRKNPRVEEAPLQQETMLFDPLTSKFYLLNPTMALTWNRCGEHDNGAVIDEMIRTFRGVDRSRAEADLRQALQQLAEMGLLIDAKATVDLR